MNSSFLLRLFLVNAVFSGFIYGELKGVAIATTLREEATDNRSKGYLEAILGNIESAPQKNIVPREHVTASDFHAENANKSQLISTPTETQYVASLAAHESSPSQPSSVDRPVSPTSVLAQTDNTTDENNAGNNVEFSGDTLRITVTGTRTPLRIDDLPATVTVFELEDLEFYQFDNLQDLLRYEPGVSVRNNPRYGLQDVNIRGLEGNRILFQVDGIRLPERFEFGPFNLGRGEFVDFATLQAIEILRGPASTLYGSDALGGVVSFRSLEPQDLLGEEDDFAADISSSYRSEVGGFNNVGRLALRRDNSEAVFVVSRRDGREADSFASEEFVDSIDFESTTLYGNFVHRINAVSRVSFIAEDLSRFTRRNEAEGNLSLNLSEEEDILIDRTRLSFTYEYDDPDSLSFLNFARAQLFYQDATTTELLRETRDSGSAFRGQPVFRATENRFIADSYGGDLQLRSDFVTGSLSHRLTYGLDVSNTFNSRPRDRIETNLNTGESTRNIPPDTFPVKDFPDGDTLRLGAYIQDEIEIGQFDIIAGLRFDYYDLTTNPDEEFTRNGAESVDLDASALSPRLAVLYQATPEISLYGQYARGFRAPLYSEINSGFTNLTGAFFKYETLSNPDLEPETSNSFEVGMRGNFPRFDFDITGFYNTYDNFIETFVAAGTRCLVDADPCPTLPPFRGGTQTVNQFQTQNVAEARIYGIEVSGEYRFSPDQSGFSILGSLAFAEGDNLTENEPLETVDPITGVVGLRYRAPNDLWRAELISTIVGQPRVADDANTFVPDAYALFDLIGSYNPTPNLAFNIGIYNLFNTEYYIYSDVRNQPEDAPDIRRFSQPGTNIRFGLSYSF